VLAPATALAALVSGNVASAGPTPPEQSAATRTYTVRPGDTLSRIAARHGVTLAHLFSINGLGAQSVLRPGQVIRIGP